LVDLLEKRGLAMTAYLFHGGLLLDPRHDELLGGWEVLVVEDRITEVSDHPIGATKAIRINLEGRTLMPGLIDAHVHLMLPEVNFSLLESIPLTLLAVKATHLIKAMLMRGFTSARDVGGCDYGMKLAVDAGLVVGPRLFICGRALTQTGGQADVRQRNQNNLGDPYCSALNFWSRVVDGVPEMQKAVRDELRKGADHIKLMGSGGVLSKTGSLHCPQFSVAEIEVACQEARTAGSYVCAHAYTGDAIARAVNAGVRTIEHGNLLDEPTAKLMAERGAFLVPTLTIFDALKRRGADYGLAEESRQKNDVVLQAGLRSLELAHRCGVSIGYGTDLVGDLHEEQSHEFVLRSEVMRPIEIIRSATINNARILRRENELGRLVPGALADLLVVDGNPLQDLSVLQQQGERLAAIMKGGCFYKNRISN
jgi:imidazolonepropionase-like amidohydrolase